MGCSLSRVVQAERVPQPARLAQTSRTERSAAFRMTAPGPQTRRHASHVVGFLESYCEGVVAMPSNGPETCLTGVKVLDLTQFEAGPSCTEALAWLGADVVKIENPKLGDPGRRRQPGKPDDDPWYFYIFNANKKSMTVNLKSPRGLGLVKDLLRKADVCVENFAPGTIERLGLGYEDMKALNPGIIYCQVKGFGEGSPFETNLAFDMIAQACGGTMSVTGEAGRMPVKPGI